MRRGQQIIISMMKITLLLIGFVQISSVWPVLPIQYCDNLRMFNGDEQVMNFACNDYNRSDSCREGPHGFPPNLSQGHSVGKPRDTSVSIFRRNFSNNAGETFLATGLKLEWKVPADGVSLQSTKGYYIRMLRANSGHVKCRLFDLQNERLSSPKIRFIYEFFPFTNKRAETYLIKIFSLPPPDDIAYEEGLYAEHVISVPKRLDFRKTTARYPKYWKTSIYVRQYPEEGKMQVEFGLPERGSLANFTSFHINLISRHSSKRLSRVVYRTTGSETYGRHVFSNVSTGTYKITVVPVNDDCQCWEMVFNRKDCSAVCGASSTAYFNFTWNKAEIPDTTSSTTVQDPGDSDGTTVIVLVTCLTFVGFLLCGCLLLLVRRRRKSHQRHRDCRNSSAHHSAVYHSVALSTVPQMQKKTIFLLASEDHAHYKKALETFTRFLQLHCCCDVMVDPLLVRGMQKTGNTYDDVDNADFIIIMLSKGASSLYSALQKGQVYAEADFGPEGDLFTPGIRSICEKMASGKENVDNNVVMVRFDHTSLGDCLPLATLAPPVYHLPTQLASFLKRIHSLEDGPWDPSHMSLPLERDVEELTSGKEWITAVHDSVFFERQHPEWFVCKFGSPQSPVHTELPPVHTELDYYYQLDSGVSGLQTTSSCLHQWPPCCSHVQQGEEEQSIHEETEDGYIDKSDFVAPSVLLFDTVSATTVPYSAYMTRERPAEIDSVSSITEQFDQLNERYEERQRNSYNNDNTNTALEQSMSDFSRPKYDDSVPALPCVFATDSKALRRCGDPDCASQFSIQSA